MLAMAGSIESCDCLITLHKSNKIEINLNSDVIIQYGDLINNLVINILKEYNIKKLRVDIDDKGALDYTIKARLETALKRGELI
ncbi:MAG: citrate lyase acyl carrier protein [Bacilli bacterium]